MGEIKPKQVQSLVDFCELLVQLADEDVMAGGKYEAMWETSARLADKGVLEREQLNDIAHLVWEAGEKARDLLADLQQAISHQQFEEEGWTTINF